MFAFRPRRKRGTKISEFADEVRGPGSPGALQRGMLAPLARIGEWRGHGERYARPAIA